MDRQAFGALGAFALFASTLMAPAAARADEAIFAGGCFWCVESDFDHVDGVTDTTSGYTGGTLKDPTYQDVITEKTGHYEAVKVTYDPAKVSYDDLLTVFWHSVDPTDGGGQFCDRGPSYRTAIFTTGAAQMKAAKASEAAIAADLKKPVATTIAAAGTFYPAEDYHQDYYRKNPLKYQYYRTGCGRNGRVDAVWGDKAYLGLKGQGQLTPGGEGTGLASPRILAGR